MLWLVEPKYSLMTPWTMIVTRFTKTITSSFKVSVISVKFLRLHKPNIASTFRPGTMVFRLDALSPFMFWAMISAPASPKPRASNEPILMIVFSSTTVSMESGSLLVFSVFLQQSRPNGSMSNCKRMRMPEPSESDWRPFVISSMEKALMELLLWRARDFFAWLSAFRLSPSPMVIAAKGLFLILSTLAIIRSMGWSTYLLASFEKVTAPMPSNKQMNSVCPMFKAASNFEPSRRSKTSIQ
mmetsp:Transcript_121044/g.349724  ORF Transcript_121044/g.349724 Transcript_121044/m.349724 type:complete len:241 (-) Transcript_121044:899-1621(-)